MDRVEFKLLDYEKWRIVKTIRLVKKLGNRHVWADIVYTRSVTKWYNKKIKRVQIPPGLFININIEYPEDDLDKIILNSVRQEYPDAFFSNANVFTDMDVAKYRKRYENYCKELAILYLTPNICELEDGTFPVGSKFPVYRIPLDIYIPSQEFHVYFMNEGYFINYNISMEKDMDNFINNIIPTFHNIEEVIRQ